MATTTATRARLGGAAAGRRSRRGRLAGRALGIAASTLQRLPDRQLHRLADAAGRALYRAQPARRQLVRDNLRTVCEWLAAEGLAGPAVARAAGDERELERLVRDAFGHYVRGYLEGAIAPVYGRPSGSSRITADRPELVDEMLGTGGAGRAAIIVGLHFGAIEVPGIQAASMRGVQLTTPMETLADPDLQGYFMRTRGSTGLRIIPTRGAGRVLSGELAAGRPVAIVADRVVNGAGARVTLFGAPARLPLGPAVLAIESGAPAWVVGARRTGWGDYRARIELLETPQQGTRRERLAAFLDGQARAFERIVADAPEQWWTLFFPIWEEARGGAGAAGATGRAAGRAG